MRERVQHIVDLVGTSTAWPDKATKDEAFALAREIAGYNPSNRNCPACNARVRDILRQYVGLPPAAKSASDRLYQRRLDVCRGVAGDGSDACEHLAWPGLNCGLCGCFIDLKARMRKMACPADKWPMK